MNLRPVSFIRFFVVLSITLNAASKCCAQYTNGLYAEFNTSLGSYTCALYYAQAPKAVANFIGLSTGQRAWLDLPSGLMKTNPFYNGLTFHRVITNFVIQAGSPNGLGTDGPGYAFVDEITNTLQFNKYGVLAMANSGPDSSGSQFFVTATNSVPTLNNGYTIFGQLYGGSNIVYAINHVATDSNNKPLANVFINTVKIQRVGATAAAFDITAQGLPVVTNLDLKIARAGTNVSLVFSNRLYADNRLYTSSDLANWTANELGIEITAPVSNTNLESAAAAAQFFHEAQIQYASSTFAPKNVFGRTLTLVITNNGSGTLAITFDLVGTGTYTFTANPSGAVTSYTWIQAPYNGKLFPIFYSSLNPMTLALNYDIVTAGTFSGTSYPNYPFTFGSFGFSGTFTSSP